LSVDLFCKVLGERIVSSISLPFFKKSIIRSINKQNPHYKHHCLLGVCHLMYHYRYFRRMYYNHLLPWWWWQHIPLKEW
jgi:hypothetical protein